MPSRRKPAPRPRPPSRGAKVSRPPERSRPAPSTRPAAARPARPARPANASTAPAIPDRVRRRLGRIHHVALVVGSLESSLRLWRDTFGLPFESIADVGPDRVRIAFLTSGESKIELVQPTDETTGVARFLETKGEGFHHVCFEVDNLAETLLRLEIDGLELIDTSPRRGADGPVAFIHPRSCHGVLVELIEAPGGPSWQALGISAPSGPASRP